MNKKLLLYILFLIPMLCVSCDWSDESDRESKIDVTKIDSLSNALKQRLSEQDSLYSELVTKIDSLTNGLNESRGNIQKLQSEIAEFKSPGFFLAGLALFSLLVSIVAIVLSFIRTNKKVDKWEAKDMTREMVKEQVNALEFRLNRAEGDIRDIGKGLSSSKDASVNRTIDKRLQEIELRISKIEKCNDTVTSASPIHGNDFQESNIQKEQEFMRMGYAKVNSTKYFVEIFNSQHEDCVYKISFNNQEEGEFDIISLGKIKTINDLKDVLELAPGSCLLNEASTHKVVEKGRCKKIDDRTWEVTKRLVIKVFK